MASKDFAEQKAMAILDAWGRVKTPDDPKWPKMYAEAAIAAGLPCFESATGPDLGADGWRRWAAESTIGCPPGDAVSMLAQTGISGCVLQP